MCTPRTLANGLADTTRCGRYRATGLKLNSTLFTGGPNLVPYFGIVDSNAHDRNTQFSYARLAP